MGFLLAHLWWNVFRHHLSFLVAEVVHRESTLRSGGLQASNDRKKLQASNEKEKMWDCEIVRFFLEPGFWNRWDTALGRGLHHSFCWNSTFFTYIHTEMSHAEMSHAEMSHAEMSMQKCHMHKSHMRKCYMQKCHIQKCHMRKLSF